MHCDLFLIGSTGVTSCSIPFKWGLSWFSLIGVRISVASLYVSFQFFLSNVLFDKVPQMMAFIGVVSMGFMKAAVLLRFQGVLGFFLKWRALIF